jgi:thiamine kinase-like enzyme
MIDFVHMDLMSGNEPIPLKEGQTVLVDFEGARMAMKVLTIYSDGTFDGQVDWEEA